MRKKGGKASAQVLFELILKMRLHAIKQMPFKNGAAFYSRIFMQKISLRQLFDELKR